jgi:hypothetical protein
VGEEEEEDHHTPLRLHCREDMMKLIIALQLSSALFALSAFAGWAQAVNPAVIRGREFVDTVTNQRLQIVGVEYVEHSSRESLDKYCQTRVEMS